MYASNIAFVMNSVLDDSRDATTLDPSGYPIREPLSLSIAVKDGSNTFTLRAWTNSDSPQLFKNTDSQPGFDVVIPCRESEAHLGALLSMLSLRHVRCLEIGPMDLLGHFGAPSAIVAWFQIFSQLREVHTLRIHQLDDALFWLALLLPQEFAGATPRFPNLRTLELVGLRFRRPMELYIEPRPPGGQEHPAELTFTELSGHPDDLLQCLALRNTAGWGVQKLVIQRARNFFEEDFRFLKTVQAAAEIQWDGVEEYVDGKLVHLPSCPILTR